MSAAIAIRDLDFGYGRRHVLHGVNLTVERGGLVTIVGPNGGGKTTLLKLMLGLLDPARGEVRILGEPPAAVRRRMGYLPQRHAADPAFPISVLQVVMTGRLGGRPALGPPRRRDREAARAALARVEAEDLAGRPFAHLSGGQQQRVLIARALVTEPELLLLDEPTAGLDPGSQAELFRLLSHLGTTHTVVLVSHDVTIVSRHVRQVVCVHDGHVHTPATREIGRDLAAIFPGMDDMVLVEHLHDDCPPIPSEERDRG